MPQQKEPARPAYRSNQARSPFCPCTMQSRNVRNSILSPHRRLWPDEQGSGRERQKSESRVLTGFPQGGNAQKL